MVLNRLFRSPRVKLSLILLMALGLAACGPSHPLGIADSEWQTMTSEQRMAAREKQVELDKVRAQERAERARLRAEEEARQQALIEERRANAQYGERVQCVLTQAEARLSGSWRSIEQTGFDLVIGEVKPFTVQHVKDGRTRHSRTGYASFDGQTVSMCLHARNNTSSSNCATLVATTSAYERGVREQVSSGDFVRGSLQCDLVMQRPQRRYR